MENYSSISDSKESILLPIEGNMTGLDISKDAQFFYIKSELNKLDNIAVGKIKRQCIELLCKKSKDLRLLVYIIFCDLVDNESLDEWKVSLNILTEFLLKYQSKLYPIKNETKVSSILWLNQDRVKFIFMKRIREVSCDTLIQYQKLVSELNQCLAAQEWISGENISLNFESWLKEQIKILPNSIKKAVVLEERPSVTQSKKIIISSPVELFDKTIRNLSDLESMTLSIIDYCDLNGRLVQAAAYRRSLRWACLMPKIDKYGVTALACFSEESNAALESCKDLLEKDPKLCYKKCEALFLLPGGQVKIDIQYYAIKSADKFNPELADFVRHALFGFIKRFSGVEGWKYNNQEDCTSTLVQKWVREKIIIANDSGSENKNSDLSESNDELCKYKNILVERDLMLLRKICNVDFSGKDFSKVN